MTPSAIEPPEASERVSRPSPFWALSVAISPGLIVGGRWPAGLIALVGVALATTLWTLLGLVFLVVLALVIATAAIAAPVASTSRLNDGRHSISGLRTRSPATPYWFRTTTASGENGPSLIE